MIGRPPKRHPYRGELLTVEEICQRSGLDVSTIRTRIMVGAALDAPYGAGRMRWHEVNGVPMTRKQIAAMLGLNPKTIEDRYRRGKPLTDPPQRRAHQRSAGGHS
jgi:hypothetical protein